MKSVNEAEKKIESLNIELKLMDQKDHDIKKKYFEKFNNAKSQLRQVRQQLRELADKTVKETKNLKILINDLDNENNTKQKVLKLSLKKMHKLMAFSETKLNNSAVKYNNAITHFDNLNSEVQEQNGYLEKLLNKKSAEHEAWVTKIRTDAYASTGVLSPLLGIGDFFGCLGLCSLIGSVILGSTVGGVESKIANYEAELGKFERITKDILKGGIQINETMVKAKVFLEDEIVIIGEWKNNVGIVKDNIELNDEEDIREIDSIRTIFMNGLNDLEKSAQDFLSREKLFGKEKQPATELPEDEEIETGTPETDAPSEDLLVKFNLTDHPDYQRM